MDCEELEELSGAYVLGALSPEERQLVDAHLVDCPRCQHMLQEMQAVVNLLPLSVPPERPSPLLGERILARIQAGEVQGSGAGRRAMPLRRMSYPQKMYRRPVWTVRLLASAAIIFLCLSAGLSAWNLSLQQQLAHVVASTNSTYRAYRINGTQETSQVAGQLLYFPQQHLTAFVVHGLPALQGAQVYQGWLLQGKHPRSIGLLNLQNGTATINFAGDIRGYDTAAISVEPGPQASPGLPKGEIVATGSLKDALAQGNDLQMRALMFSTKMSRDVGLHLQLPSATTRG